MTRKILQSFVILVGFASTFAYASYEEALAAIQKKDYVTALPLLNAAAEKSDPRALNALGIVYFQGLGVTRDEKIAISWWEKAADADNLNAMNGLASLYGRGSKDTPKNLQLAREWAWKASLTNDANAQFNYFQLVNGNELSRLDATGRMSRDKYMALAKRTVAERELDEKAYTMLSRAAEQGHLGATVVSIGLLTDNVGPNNTQKLLGLIDTVPMARLPPQITQMLQAAKASSTHLKSLGQTYVSGSVFRDAFMTAMMGAYVKANVQSSACEAKNVRMVKASVTREMNQPVYVNVSSALLKDVVLIQGDWQETWAIDLCGTSVEVPLEFQADGGGGAYFQTSPKKAL